MMNKTKAEAAPAQVAQHTLGPWHYADDTYHLGGREFIGIGNGACHIGYASVTCAVRSAEAKANARLIAAAPDLLEACDMVQRAWAGDGVDMATAADACLLAIQKAEGKL